MKKVIIKDYSDLRQPQLLKLNADKNNWRLYYNVAQEDGLWVADFVPQPWQEDVISENEPDTHMFDELSNEINQMYR